MSSLFQLQSGLLLVVTLVLFAFKAWAFVDALSHRPQTYVAAEKLTKQAWLIILGLSVVANILLWGAFNILNLIGTVATIVYIVDVRPALRSLTGPR